MATSDTTTAVPLSIPLVKHYTNQLRWVYRRRVPWLWPVPDEKTLEQWVEYRTADGKSAGGSWIAVQEVLL